MAIIETAPAGPAPPRVVAMDLTPVLPGGANGGAKVFVLELVRELGLLAPGTEFVVLARAAAFDELAVLDSANVRRHLVGAGLAQAGRNGAASRAVRWLRGPVRGARALARRAGLEGIASWDPRRPRGLLRGLHADLLFCPFTAPDLREAGIPVVCTLYDLQYQDFPQFFAPADRAQRDRAFRDACQHATLLAAISEFTRRSAMAQGAIAADRIRTVLLRVARRVAGPEARPASDRLLARLVLERGRYLLYPANFWPHKNHETLLQAFARAGSLGLPPDTRLVCTGAPDERMEAVRAAAARVGLADRVRFPGYLDEREFAALLHDAGAVIFPSLYEGFGMPVVEAMAAGIPVACSNTTSLPEIAGDAALLFDPRDTGQIARAILDVMTDAELRSRLAALGRARGAEFCDARRMAAEYWDLFLAARAAGPQSGKVRRK